MTKTLLIHVGAPKTGSTAFQYLAKSNNRLLKQNGVNYPAYWQEIEAIRLKPVVYVESGNADEVASLFGTYLPAAEKSAKITAVLENRVRASNGHRDDVVILSCENLFYLNEKQWASLKDILRHIWSNQDLRIRPVIVVRDLLDRAISWWAHLVRRNGYPHSLESYLANDSTPSQIDAVGTLASVFGKENVIIIKYAEPQTVLKAMLELAGLKLEDAFWHKFGDIKLNQSLTRETLEILQRCEAVFPEGSWETNFEGLKVKNELLWRCGDILETAAVPGTSLVTFSGVTARAIKREFNDKYAEAVANFNAAYDVVGGPLEVGSDIIGEDGLAAKDAAVYHHAWLSIFEMMTHEMLQSDRCPGQRKRIELVSLVRQSGIFDDAYYLAQIDERKPSTGIGRDLSADMALTHFMQVGWREGLKPCPYFDPLWYQQKYSDLGSSDPVEHYIRFGAAEGRTPSPHIPDDIAAEYRRATNLVSVLCGSKPRALRRALVAHNFRTDPAD